MADPLQAWLGIKSYHLIAGFAGGVVRAFVRPGATKLQAFGSCVVGALTAGYMTPVAVIYLPESASIGGEGATGFVIGLTGMAVAEGLIQLVNRWRNNPTIPKGDS